MFRFPRIPWRRIGVAGASASRQQQRILPHQVDGIAFGRASRGRLMLADDMGLGKTMQAILIANVFPKDLPALVIAPAAVVLNWRTEIQRWLGSRPVTVLRKTSDPLRRTHGFVVLSYDLARRRLPELSSFGFGIVICDESHFIKNPSALRSLAALELLLGAKRRILVSGTPTPKNAIDVFTQLHVLLPDTFPSFEDFGQKYAERSSKVVIQSRKAGQAISTATRFQGANDDFSELMLRMQKGYILRRTLDSAVSLPPLSRERIPFPCVFDDMVEDLIFWRETRRQVQARLYNLFQRLKLLGTQRKRGKGMYEGDKSQMLKQAHIYSLHIRSCISHEWQLSGKLKIQPVIELVLESLQEPDAQVLVFGHHTKVLASLQVALRKADLPHVLMDGRTSLEKREERIAAFQNKEVRIALLSITAMGQGVNLTAATHAVLAELPWTPAQVQQAVARMHRIGQQRKSKLLVPVVSWPSLDEHMIEQLEKRSAQLDQAGIMSALKWDVGSESADFVQSPDTRVEMLCFQGFVQHHLKRRREDNSNDGGESHSNEDAKTWADRCKLKLKHLRFLWASMDRVDRLRYQPKDVVETESSGGTGAVVAIPTARAIATHSMSLPWPWTPFAGVSLVTARQLPANL